MQQGTMNGHLNGYANLGAPPDTAAMWGGIVFAAVAVGVIAPTVIDTLVKSKVLGFNNKYSTKKQIARSAAVGAVIGVPMALLYGAGTYTAVRAS
tara:strand:- start:7682 stop:7966 length:285 start_codon:yes stop_codon:yes gene_type:complete